MLRLGPTVPRQSLLLIILLTAASACARRLPPDRSAAALYRDLERLVTVAETTGWGIDRKEVEGLESEALDSLCRVDPLARRNLREWLDGEVARAGGPNWFREPWPLVLPQGGISPPIMLLIESQGATHDGGIYDDSADDTDWDRISWANAVRTWNVDFLRDNPLAQLYTTTEAAAGQVLETAGQVAEGANQAAKGVATILKWAPYVLAGIGAIGATAIVLAVANKTSQPSPTP